MEISGISLEDVVARNLTCVEEGLVSKSEAMSEIVEFIKSNFIPFAGFSLNINLGQLDRLKKESGFEVMRSGNMLCLTKEIQIYKKGGKIDGVQ